jgi:MFS family permease
MVSKMNEAMLRRNLRLYGWFKVFNKRVFLPLTAVYLVDVGHVSLHGIGVIAAVTGLVTLLAQMPTGYLSDRYTRRMSLITGSALLAVGVGVLVFWPSLLGGLIAGTLSGTGFAFISGAGQALIHDSLEQCGLGNQYIKEMGRAQSKGLVGNIVLVGLVPMTYTIDKRLPFILGVVAFLILLLISWLFVEPKRNERPQAVNHLAEITTAIRSFVRKHTLLLFVAIGLVYGLYSAPTDYSNLILKDLGLLPQYIGWAYAVSSLLAAAGGFGMHYLQKLSFRAFMYVDIVICCGFFVTIGVTRSLAVALVVFLINMAFWRLRSIMYQYYLLEIFRGTTRKATLVSLLGFGEQLFVVVLPMLFAVCIGWWGYYAGYVVIGLVAAALLSIMTVLGFKSLAQMQPDLRRNM